MVRSQWMPRAAFKGKGQSERCVWRGEALTCLICPGGPKDFIFDVYESQVLSKASLGWTVLFFLCNCLTESYILEGFPKCKPRPNHRGSARSEEAWSLEFPKSEPQWITSVYEIGGLEDSVTGSHSKGINIRLRWRLVPLYFKLFLF